MINLVSLATSIGSQPMLVQAGAALLIMQIASAVLSTKSRVHLLTLTYISQRSVLQ